MTALYKIGENGIRKIFPYEKPTLRLPAAAA